MPTVLVRFHAAARELAGLASAPLELLGPADRDALLHALRAAHPGLAPHLARMRLALDGDFVDGEFTLREGSEIDLLPPVAGGSSAVVLCEVRETPLSLDELRRAVSRDDAGGIALFVGVVRDHADGKPVARLDYESHPSLAVKEMRRVLESVAAEVPGSHLAVVHRVGTLAVGDDAIIVAASAPHRAEAFEACRRAIDRIKETVPIWKKEWGPDGSAHWVNLEGP